MIIYFDLDGTLKSDINAIPDHGKTHTIKEDWRGDSFSYTFIERPHLKEALALLTGHKLRLATMGKRSYALLCLEAMGIREYFEELVCGVEFRRPNKCVNFTIVDDRQDLLDWKAEQISHDERYSRIVKILIPSYKGGYDEELIKVANKILETK